MMSSRGTRTVRYLALLGLALFASHTSVVHAVPLLNDPKGFHNIAWGAPLTARPEMEVTRAGPHVDEYRLKNEVTAFAGVPVESIRYLTVDHLFARVTIRYQGESSHKQIVAYLQQQFGPLERLLPGQMMRGLNQQYNWRGTETEINLTYNASTERGFIFIDSRSLAPRFNDQLADTGD
jgi:hypothetical protein